MAFHAPLKALNPVDIKLPDHLVKGAVILDEDIREWNPAIILDSSAAMSTFIVINKQAIDLDDVLTRVANELKLPASEDYGLIFEEPRAFLSPSTINRVVHGFMLTCTAAPRHYVKRLIAIFSDRSDQNSLEWAIGKFDSFATDPYFIDEFFRVTTFDILYDLLEDETVDSSASGLSILLHAILCIYELNIESCGWSSAPLRLVQKLATLVTGRAKREESNTVLIALQMIDQMLNTESVELRNSVMEAVPLQALIRHLEKSDERVNLVALAVMNSLHNNSDEATRRDIVQHLESKPFRMAVGCSVLREGRSRDRNLLDQLVPLQRVVLNQLVSLSQTAPNEEELDLLVASDVLQCNTEQTWESDRNTVRESGLGQLAVSALLHYVKNHEDDIRILVSENAMRVGNGGWQLFPMYIQCLSIVVDLLGITPSEDDRVEQFIELLYSIDAPLDSLFSIVVQLFHRTWREMNAAKGEAKKVGCVVREQLLRIAKYSPPTITALDEQLSNLTYWKMQDLWKREQAEKENDQLGSDTVSELRALLRPSMEHLVRSNRKNFMKQGYTFRRSLKAKTPQKDQYSFWRLDMAEKVIIMIETDTDPYLEGSSTIGKIRKVNIKEISSVLRSDDGTATVRKGIGSMRGLQLVLLGGDVLSAAAQADHALCAWVDGLNDLIGIKSLSRDASNMVDRLLNVELRLRLTDVPQPRESTTSLLLPSQFTWVTPHLHRT